MDLKYFASVLILETFRSGATGVVANDIDPNCRLALDMNAELSKQSLAGVEMVEADLLAGDNDTRMEVLRSTDVVLVGDMFYDEHIGGEVYNLCSTFKSLKKENEVSVFVLRSKDNDSPPQVYVGDPGRWALEEHSRFHQSFACCAKYNLAEATRLENNGFSTGLVWRLNKSS